MKQLTYNTEIIMVIYQSHLSRFPCTALVSFTFNISNTCTNEIILFLTSSNDTGDLTV